MAGYSAGDYRHKLRELSNRFQNLFTSRRYALEDYENFSNTLLSDLIGTTAPAALDSFNQAAYMQDVYSEDFVPAMQDYLSSAQEYDTQERRASERGRAMTDVGVGAEAARRGAIERLESYGIDPSQTRGAALDANLRLNTALEQARAGNEAERSVEERGRAYVRDALGLGGELLYGGMALTDQGQRLMSGNVEAANRTFANTTNMYDQSANLLRSAVGPVTEAAGSREREDALDAADSGSSGLGGAIGRLGGTLAGAAVGSMFGPAGSTAGMMIGAQAGGEAGGSFGGYADQRYR